MTLTQTHPSEVAALLDRFVDDLKQKIAKRERAAHAFSIFRECLELGAHAHGPALKIIDAYGASNRGIQVLAVELVRHANPTTPLVEHVAEIVLRGNGRRQEAPNAARTVLELLHAGLTSENCEPRIRLVAYRLRDLERQNMFRYIEKVPLSAEPERNADLLLLAAHHLTLLVTKARQQGTATTDLLDWTNPVEGHLGARIVSQI